MHTEENEMDTKFVALDISRQMLRELRPIVAAIGRHDRDLKNQLQRAATSVHLNLGESRGRAGGDRRRCFEIAAGSAFEVEAALDAAEAWGWIDDPREARRIVRRMIGLLWGLRRTRP